MFLYKDKLLHISFLCVPMGLELKVRSHFRGRELFSVHSGNNNCNYGSGFSARKWSVRLSFPAVHILKIKAFDIFECGHIICGNYKEQKFTQIHNVYIFNFFTLQSKKNCSLDRIKNVWVIQNKHLICVFKWFCLQSVNFYFISNFLPY